GGEDPTWWKFWSARTWSAWWRRRRAWNEYRDRATSLDARIASAAEHRERAATEAGAARRRLAWIRQPGPRGVPIRTARTETGLEIGRASCRERGEVSVRGGAREEQRGH